jgi:lysophospholipase L1-like esterase
MASAELSSLTAPSRIPLRTRLLLVTFGTIASILVLEGALRVARFEYHLMPTVQFGWPDPQTIQTNYAPDPDLFWVTRDYREKLRAARRSHPAVIFMGDSCTEFGTYPARTVAILAEEQAPVSSGMHLATGGWSSEQGLAQMKRDVVPLHPKIAVIYYGWNDHWIALGPTDPALMLAHRLVWLSDHLRIMQVALKATMGISARNDRRPNRVPPARYRENLMRMTALARDGGIRTILVTAPSNHVVGHEPPYLLQRHVRQLSDVVPLHQEYVALTRTAAHVSGAVLCDAAAGFDALPGSHDGLFRADGIHFTPEGDERLAGIVSRCITDAVR